MPSGDSSASFTLVSEEVPLVIVVGVVVLVVVTKTHWSGTREGWTCCVQGGVRHVLE